MSEKEFNPKRLIFIPIFFGSVLIFSYVSTCQSERRNFPKYASLVVARIDTSESMRKTYYDKSGKELGLEGFTFTGDYGIRIGDSLVKRSGSDTLYFYRKDNSGHYIVFGQRTY
ncbi:MAG TPA: hypothetical protein VK541_04395 [Pedobacter sp.]|uniref:hypothetical protein n=1 Tax=Pedobacter sp. TaxID=1411316 RepID=UPI002CC33236|nr:hypothetical protein [Pedobacter sp.]HMI01696.1 hypothetical protein [Pedobacter sp.]